MVVLISHTSNSIFRKNPIRRVFPNPVTNKCTQVWYVVHFTSYPCAGDSNLVLLLNDGHNIYKEKSAVNLGEPGMMIIQLRGQFMLYQLPIPARYAMHRASNPTEYVHPGIQQPVMNMWHQNLLYNTLLHQALISSPEVHFLHKTARWFKTWKFRRFIFTPDPKPRVSHPLPAQAPPT